MKLVQTTKTLETNADFTSQDFTIGDVSVVIEILRNKLYRHKVRTLVQEYISNARDAMREVNNKEDRIEITVPTMFQPTFKVRDFGLGISPDRMYNVFIKYASSTKRKDNVQTGGFGIGAKSAWSYTESFTIVTYIDGIQRTYIAHIGANNNGRLDFMGEAKTNEANGTEIQIPVSPKDVTEFKQAVLRATYFWKSEEKPILKGISKEDQVEYIQGDMIGNLEINNKLPSFIAVTWGKGVVISIDGIPYFVDDSIIEKTKSLPKLCDLVTGRLVLHINNGELEVSASREEISDSKFTLDNLERIGQGMVKEVNNKIVQAFSKVKSPFDHLSVYMKLKDFYNLSNYSKYGDFIVNDRNGIESDLFQLVKAEHCAITLPKNELSKEQLNKSRRRYGRRAAINADWFNHLFFCDGSETAIINNLRIRSYLQSNPSMVVFTREADPIAFNKLKTGLGLKDLKTISYTKPTRKPREIVAIERTKQEFCVRDLTKYSNQAKYLTLENNKQKWLYVEYKPNIDKSNLRELSEYLNEDGYKICALSQDAMRRVKGDKNFKPLADYLKNYKISKRDILALKYEIRKHSDIIEKLGKCSGLNDRFLVDMINEYKTHKGNEYIIPDMLKKVLGKVDEVEQFKIDDITLGQELKKYPLLNLMYWPNIPLNDVVIYMNAKHKENENV